MHELSEGGWVTGKVLLDEVDIYASDVNPIQLRRRIGMVFQRPTPFPTMSIYDNVAAGLRVNGRRPRREMDEAVERALRQAALWDEAKDRLHASALELSGGQQQRLCIARAIAPEPEILLLDEPTASLDPAGTQRIEELCHELKRLYTIVIVTHNLQQAARVSDYTAFFYMGRLIEVGRTSDLFTRPKVEQTRRISPGGLVDPHPRPRHPRLQLLVRGHAGPARRHVPDSAACRHCPDRPVGMRQDDVPAVDQPAARPDAGDPPHRRHPARGGVGIRARDRHRGVAPPRGHGVPAAQSVPQAGVRQRRVRPAAQRLVRQPRAAGSRRTGAAPGRAVGRGARPAARARHRLSGGQQQRLCIARALANEPDVLLMDEPCSALDPIATQRIEELIVELKRTYTIVIVTHNMQQAARVSDYAGFFYLGNLVEFGKHRTDLHPPR